MTKYILLFWCSCLCFSIAQSWPQWRGPTGNGVSSEKNVPVTWSKTSVGWKADLPGESASTPAIWKDHIFLTAADGDHHIACCFSTDGKLRWKKTLADGLKVVRGGEGNSACVSPITDGRHVWFFCATGDWSCFDFEGREIWKTNLQERYGKFRVGFIVSTTPVLHENRLLYHVCQAQSPFVLAINALTGQELWKVERKTDARNECEHAYTSPILYRGKNGTVQLVSHGSDYIVGYDPATGRELWRSGNLQQDPYHKTLRFVASPAAIPGRIVVPTAKNCQVIAIDPTGAEGDITDSKAHQLWRMDKGTPDVPCPLIHDGIVYLCRERTGMITALDLESGEQIYQERIHGGLYRGSPVYADGHIYFTCRDGTITVIKAGRTFEIVATNTLGDAMTASPAFSNGVLYLHTHKALYAIPRS